MAWPFLPGDSGAAADRGHIVMLADDGLAAVSQPRLAIPAASRAPPPASLAGTMVDGSITLDVAGHFVADKNALRLFEYFFSADGEESQDVLRGRILLHALRTGLSEAATAEVAAVLDRYLTYRDAARATLVSGKTGVGDLGSSVSEMRALQLRLLGPDLARAFYGDDTRLADIGMRRLAVLRNVALNQAQRRRALDTIDAELPQEVRDARQASIAPSALHQRVEAVRGSGGTSEEIAALRRAEYGADAAERLGALDRSRERWTQRLTRYRSEELALRSAYGSPDSQTYRAAVEALRERHFSGEERLRVQALDMAR